MDKFIKNLWHLAGFLFVITGIILLMISAFLYNPDNSNNHYLGKPGQFFSAAFFSFVAGITILCVLVETKSSVEDSGTEEGSLGEET